MDVLRFVWSHSNRRKHHVHTIEPTSFPITIRNSNVGTSPTMDQRIRPSRPIQHARMANHQKIGSFGVEMSLGTTSISPHPQFPTSRLLRNDQNTPRSFVAERTSIAQIRLIILHNPQTKKPFVSTNMFKNSDSIVDKKQKKTLLS